MSKSRTAQAVLEGLRSPLNGVVGLIDTLAATRLTNQQRQYLHVLKSTITQLGVIVEDCADLPNLSESTRVTSFDPTDVLASVRDAFLSAAYARSIELSLTSSPEVPERLLGDAIAFRQLSYAAIERVFEVSRAWVRGAVDFDGENVHFRVSSDALAPAFHPTVLSAPGIAGALGGRWNCERTGEGWTAGFSIPARVDASASPESPVVLALRSSIGRHRVAVAPSRILLVEDQSSTRTIIRNILERAGHLVTESATAHDALELLQTRLFDVLLVDLHLGAMSGPELIRIFRYSPSGTRTPVVGMSVDQTEDAKEECSSAGMICLVSKPISPDRLLAAISFALSPAARYEQDLDAMPGTAIDLAILLETRALVGDSVLRGFVEQSLLDAHSALSNIAQAAIANDSSAWRDALHALRGVALMVGATRLGNAAAAMLESSEMHATRDATEILPRLLRDAEAALKTALT